jgi:hypothetical protein
MLKLIKQQRDALAQKLSCVTRIPHATETLSAADVATIREEFTTMRKLLRSRKRSQLQQRVEMVKVSPTSGGVSCDRQRSGSESNGGSRLGPRTVDARKVRHDGYRASRIATGKHALRLHFGYKISVIRGRTPWRESSKLVNSSLIIPASLFELAMGRAWAGNFVRHAVQGRLVNDQNRQMQSYACRAEPRVRLQPAD